jgi:hypothetical protein
MPPHPPLPGDVILAIIAVVLGSLGAAAAAYSGRRNGNWLAYVCALGCLAFVAGVAAQRAFPSMDAIARLGSASAQDSAPGPWDAGVSLPLVAIRLTPVSIGGLLLAAIGLSLLLLFERVPDPARKVAPPPRQLEEDDAV